MIKNIVQLDRKIRIAIVGCGRISKKHFESIESHADQLHLVSYAIQIQIFCLQIVKYHLSTYLNLDEMMRMKTWI